MAITRQSPRVFTYNSTGSLNSTAGTVSTTSGGVFQLGFRPKLLQIENLGSVPLYLTFGSTMPPTTCSSILISTCTPGNLFYVMAAVENGVPTMGMDIFSLGSTVTSGGTGNAQPNIWALG